MRESRLIVRSDVPVSALMRLILDTNVLVSARIGHGVPRELFDAWLEQRRFDLIVCPTLMGELSRVLRRQRFRSAATSDDVNTLIALLNNEAALVPDPTDIPSVTADPDDDYLVALARRERVDILVSGDRHLTGLDIEILVLTPGEALARLT